MRGGRVFSTHGNATCSVADLADLAAGAAAGYGHITGVNVLALGAYTVTFTATPRRHQRRPVRERAR
ncbi:hypothetical protein AB0M44_38235 [Streptosporangium subroseum]|uniref:hypothetical protein n=1 Tax=Streptosporangium subroseum TaxID=106412 RepID=UPI00342F159A